MLLTLVAALLSAQADGGIAPSRDLQRDDVIAVLLARRTGLSLDETSKLAGELGKALAGVGFSQVLPIDETDRRLKTAGISDTTACGGRSPCLISAGTHIGANVVVLVSGSRVGTERVWVLEVFDAVTEQAIHRVDWVENVDAPDYAKVKELAVSLAARLVTRPPPPVEVVKPVEPKPVEPKIAITTPQRPTQQTGLRTVAWVPFVLGGALGLAAGGCFLGAFTDAQALLGATSIDVHATAMRGNALQTAGIVLAGSAIVAGLVSLGFYLFGAPTPVAMTFDATNGLSWVMP